MILRQCRRPLCQPELILLCIFTPRSQILRQSCIDGETTFQQTVYNPHNGTMTLVNRKEVLFRPPRPPRTTRPQQHRQPHRVVINQQPPRVLLPSAAYSTPGSSTNLNTSMPTSNGASNSRRRPRSPTAAASGDEPEAIRRRLASLAKSERREVLLHGGDGGEGSHRVFLTTRQAVRYGF